MINYSVVPALLQATDTMPLRKITGSTLITMGAIALIGFYSYNEGLDKPTTGASASLELLNGKQREEVKWEIVRKVGLLVVGLAALSAGGYLLSRQRYRTHRITLDFTGSASSNKKAQV
jgi:hypothetical protein